MKKILAVLVVVLISVCSLANTELVDGIEWTYSISNGIAIVGGGDSSTLAIPQDTLGEITIPSELGGLTVASIGDYAFYGCSNLVSVVIPNSVTNIDDFAFANCVGIKDVYIPDSVEGIETFAFYNCSGIETLHLSTGLKYVNGGAFFGCNKIKEIIIPEGVKWIAPYAFDASGAIKVWIPDSVEGIEERAFSPYNRTIISHDYKAGYRYIGVGEYIFIECTYLKDVSIPISVFNPNIHTYNPGVTSYNYDYYGNVVGSYSSSSSWSVYSSWTFCDYGDLYAHLFGNDYPVAITNLVLTGSSYGTIPDEAFSGFPYLESITIPASVTRIGARAFKDCYALKKVIFEGDAPDVVGEDVFEATPKTLTIYVNDGTIGWNGDLTATLPSAWNGRRIVSIQTGEGGSDNNSSSGSASESSGSSITSFEGLADVIAAQTSMIISWGGQLSDTDKHVLLHSNISNILDMLTKITNGEIDTSKVTNYSALGDIITAMTHMVECFGSTLSDIEKAMLINEANNRINNLISNIGVIGNPSWNGSQNGSTSQGSTHLASLTVTNIVIHYVMNSVASEAVTPPTNSTGIVNVIAEVGAGEKPIAMTSEWTAQYPEFESKFGNDFTAAIMAKSGKKDSAGNDMFVWQDYVAGTDPTDENDVFTASITFDADTGEPVISWTPELTPTEAAKRAYKKYGKVHIADDDWTLITDGNEGDYNFFKVTVEMR